MFIKEGEPKPLTQAIIIDGRVWTAEQVDKRIENLKQQIAHLTSLIAHLEEIKIKHL